MEPGEQVGSLGFWWLLLVRNSGERFLKWTEPLSPWLLPQCSALLTRQNRFSNPISHLAT